MHAPTHRSTEEASFRLGISLQQASTTTKRIRGVHGGKDLQASVSLLHQPRPAGTEVRNRDLGEGLHECFHRSPLRLDGTLQLSLQLRLVGRHALDEKW